MKNQLPNSSFGICTALPLVRIGNAINITGWQDIGQGAGTCSVVLNSAQSQNGYCEGLIPGKLVLVDNGNANLNGIPAGGDPNDPSAIGYPLMVTECNAGSFVATLAGAVSTAGPSSTATAYEVVPGITATNNGAGPDGWGKTTPLNLYRQFKTDFDRTPVTVSGEDYACKLVKTDSSVDQFYATLPAKPYLNKTVVFGSSAFPKSGNCRLFIIDGNGWHYSPYFPVGSESWQEISLTIAASSTSVICGWEITGVAGDTCYVTQPMMDYGASIGAGNYVPTTGFHVFTTHPNFNRNYINGSISSNRLIRIEQESLGKLPKGLKAIHIGLEGNNPAASKSIEVTTDLNQAIPSLTMYSQNPNAVIVNSGIAAVGHYPEPYPSGWMTDTFYVLPQSLSTWNGVNLDMFACEL